MSAMTGICDFFAMIGSASASSVSGTATRTIWQPDAVSSAICCSVALTSAVLVVHIDCTLTGKSLPTPTPPTSSCRVLRRGARTGGGGAGMPRLTGIAMAASIPRARSRAGKRLWRAPPYAVARASGVGRGLGHQRLEHHPDGPPGRSIGPHQRFDDAPGAQVREWHERQTPLRAF